MHNLAKPIQQFTEEFSYTSKNSNDIDFILEKMQKDTILNEIIEEKKNPKIYELKKEVFFINSGMKKEITQTSKSEEVFFNIGFERCFTKLK